MTNKEKQDWLKDNYPLTIITDRYSGTYSDGYYLAFPLDYDEIPEDVNMDDMTCSSFWETYKEPVGKGSSVQAAIDDLIYKMHKQTKSKDEKIRVRDFMMKQFFRPISPDLADTLADEIIKVEKTALNEKQKESEDERIRKTLIEALTVSKSMGELKFRLPEPTREECIAWLEKQKENIEKEYVFRPLAGTDINTAALQAIRRANEGDRLVLAFNGAYIPVRKGCNANKIVDIYEAFIEKQKEQKPVEKKITLTSFEKTLNTFLFDFANSPLEDCEPKGYIKKHSAEILKAAYKELNAKLQQDIFEAKQEGIRDGYEVARAEQNPAEWSKNDTAFLNEITDFFENKTVRLQHDIDMYAHWLKSLPERFSLQPKSEWSEEDDAYRIEAVKLLENPSLYESCPNLRRETIEWLKQLPKVSVNSEQVSVNSEWSEEDEKMRWNLISAFTDKNNSKVDEFMGLRASKAEILDFLKSLRPSWKPSEDEERLINTSISFLKDFADKGYENAIECIDWLKSKLNGNACK